MRSWSRCFVGQAFVVNIGVRCIMVIGLRSFTNGFSHVVLDGTQEKPEVISADRYTCPKGTQWPESLSWVRRQMAELCDKFELSGACIKTIEPVAMKKSKERLQIEAVLIEFLHTEKGMLCTIRIKSQLKRDIKAFEEPARYLDRVLEKDQYLKAMNHPNFQDACLAAIAELPA